MKNGKWYLVYTKTHMEYDETAGCCGGIGEGGAFVDIKKNVSIALEATNQELAEVEGKDKFKKIRARLEKQGLIGYCYETKEQTLDREASDPRVVYRLRPRSKSEVEALMREDEQNE